MSPFIRFSFLFISAFFLLACAQKRDTIPTQAEDDFTYPYRYEHLSGPLVCAHRASPHERGYPENCIPSMEYLLQKGVRWMECDVRTTADGTLVLLHDESLERTTDAKGRLESKTWSEIKDVRLRDDSGQLTNFHIPRLEDVLIWNENHSDCVLMLDIKRGTSYQKVNALVKKHNQEKSVIFISYTSQQAQAVHNVNPDLVISVPVRNFDEWDRILATDIASDRMIAFTGTISSPKSLYELLHKHNITAIFGTLGNIDKRAEARGDGVYENLFDTGVDIFSTDRPIHLQKLITKNK